MVSERGVRITHSVLFTLTTLAAIIVLAISECRAHDDSPCGPHKTSLAQ
jgi:hypothetical protein